VSRLDLIVGPNGAGRSTFVEYVLAEARPGAVFVNADVIAEERWPDEPEAHGYEAAAAAEELRNILLANGEPFIAETVASHPSKVDLVRRALGAGYHVHLIVIAVPVECSVERVELRQASGGHGVPVDKIHSRYERLWDYVADMIELANSAEVFDNSGDGPKTIATFVNGGSVGAPRWPAWTPQALTDRWPT
jgi:predicted ABC-type ATPase